MVLLVHLPLLPLGAAVVDNLVVFIRVLLLLIELLIVLIVFVLLYSTGS
jgi:hypothetical protein